jgi:aerobic-type carbon monoxide dehydrogenase small subunit (CoxS/CutS family)
MTSRHRRLCVFQARVFSAFDSLAHFAVQRAKVKRFLPQLFRWFHTRFSVILLSQKVPNYWVLAAEGRKEATVSSRKPPDTPQKPEWNVSRRGFMRGVGTGALGTVVLEETAHSQSQSARGKFVGPGAVPIVLMVNGKSTQLVLEPRVTLLDALRDQLDLTGAKSTCDRGTCGSCTVLMNGKAVYACSVLAIDAQGKSIQTIESVPADDPVVTAMARHDGTQCGFCAPGMVLAAKAFLAKTPHPDEVQVATCLGGNLCRCGAYVPIRKAILEASRAAKGGRNA